MLQPPDYINEANVIGVKVTYKWEGTVHYNRESPPLIKQLARLSHAARLSVGLGIAEWIAWRFQGLAHDEDSIRLLEAGWAAMADPSYAKSWSATQEKRPHDALGGAVFAFKDQLSSLLSAERARRKSPKTSSGGPARTVVQLAFLARHVLPNAKPFDRWLKSTLARLSELHPKQSDEAFGEPVPRQALDPDFNYAPDESSTLLDGYLRGLDWKANSFLRSPEELNAAGFVGKAYRFPSES